MAPIGTGMLYVRKPLIEPLWALMAPNPGRHDATPAGQDEDIRKFEEIGTHQAAVHNAIGEALAFHEMLGGERKAARLRYMRSRWIDRVRDLKNVRFHTNLHPDHSCGICTVEIVGIKPGDLAAWMETKHRIVITPIEHPQFHGCRVSPQVYSTVSEIDKFAEAMLTAATKGVA